MAPTRTTPGFSLRSSRPTSRRLFSRPRAQSATTGVAVLLLAACGGGDDDGGGSDGDSITFWTPHSTPQRMAGQEAAAEAFTEETGIEVEVVGLAAEDQNQSLVTGAASGDVPDVILTAPDQVANCIQHGLLDGEEAQQVLDNLDPATFSESALDLVTVDDQLLAAPGDGWGQLFYYRTDLFEEAGLSEPQTLEDLASAAEELNTDGRAGIVLGTQPGDPFTNQTLESLLVGNGCQLVDDAGEIALEEPACIQGLELYQRLAEASVSGGQDVESTRAAYLAGDAAIVNWGAHLLDEIAGLDENFPVSCEECADNPQYLAENTGVVSALAPPEGKPAGYGLTLSYSIPRDNNTEGAVQFAEYMLSEGYLESLDVAAEGRVPMRAGTPDSPTEYADAWADLELGAEQESGTAISEVYDEQTIQTLVDGANTFERWGFGTEHAGLAGALYSQNTLVQDIGPLFDGADPAQVAATMAEAAEAVQQDLN